MSVDMDNCGIGRLSLEGDFYKIFFALFGINFLINLGFSMSDSFLSIYFNELGATAFLIGVSASSYQISKIFFGWFMGHTLLRFGSRAVLLTSIITFGTVFLLMTVFSDVYAVVALRILLGFACAAFRPVLYGILNCELDHVGLPKGSIFGSFDTSYYLSLAFGPLAGGLLKEKFGFTFLFAVSCILCLIAMAVYLFFISKNTSKHIDMEETYYCKRSKSEAFFYFFIAGKSVMLACFLIYFPLYLTNELNMNTFHVGMLLSIPSVVMVLMLKTMGRLADNVPYDTLVLSGGLISSVIFQFLPFTHSFAVAFLLVGIYGFSGAVSQPASMLMLLRDNEDNIACVIGRVNSVMGLSFALGALLCSLLTVYLSIRATIISTSIISLFFMIIFTVSVIERKKH